MSVVAAVVSLGACAGAVLVCWVIVVFFSAPGRHGFALLALGVASLFVVAELALVLAGETSRQRTGSVFAALGVVLSLAVNAAFRSRSVPRR